MCPPCICWMIPSGLMGWPQSIAVVTCSSEMVPSLATLMSTMEATYEFHDTEPTERHAAPGTGLRRGGLPVCLLGREVEHGQRSRLIPQEGAPEGHRILFGAEGQVVDEGLQNAHVVRRPDAAPEAGGHAGGSS